MFTEQFFELLLDFGDEWVVKEVETNFDRAKTSRQVVAIEELQYYSV